jgi:hypothetical protein
VVNPTANEKDYFRGVIMSTIPRESGLVNNFLFYIVLITNRDALKALDDLWLTSPIYKDLPEGRAYLYSVPDSPYPEPAHDEISIFAGGGILKIAEIKPPYLDLLEIFGDRNIQPGDVPSFFFHEYERDLIRAMCKHTAPADALDGGGPRPVKNPASSLEFSFKFLDSSLGALEATESDFPPKDGPIYGESENNPARANMERKKSPVEIKKERKIKLPGVSEFKGEEFLWEQWKKQDANEIYSSALEYLNLGFSIFPCGKDNGKKPLLRWKPYQNIRPGVQTLNSWLKQYQKFNIAIALGHVSGIWVFDCDDENANNWLIPRLPFNPENTRVARTAKGFHYYFRIPAGETIESRDLRGGGVEGEIKGNKTYIIAPPSLRYDIVYKYSWLHSPAWEDIPELSPEPFLKELFPVESEYTSFNFLESAGSDTAPKQRLSSGDIKDKPAAIPKNGLSSGQGNKDKPIRYNQNVESPFKMYINAEGKEKISIDLRDTNTTGELPPPLSKEVAHNQYVIVNKALTLRLFDLLSDLSVSWKWGKEGITDYIFMANVFGTPVGQGSLHLNPKTGKWRDFMFNQGGEPWGDLIRLIMFTKKFRDQYDALRWAENWLGWEKDTWTEKADILKIPVINNTPAAFAKKAGK